MGSFKKGLEVSGHGVDSCLFFIAVHARIKHHGSRQFLEFAFRLIVERGDDMGRFFNPDDIVFVDTGLPWGWFSRWG